MKPAIKYILIILMIVVTIFLSFDIKRIDGTGAVSDTFDPEIYATEFWNNDLPVCEEIAPEINELTNLLELDPEDAFVSYSHKLGISNTCYFFVKGTGKIISTDEENLVVIIDNDRQVSVAVDFIFGNAVRDGSGRVDIDDFLNMTDFNNVSVAMNRLVKEKVTAALKQEAEAGMQIKFTGAFEISEKKPDLTGIRIIPVSATLSEL